MILSRERAQQSIDRVNSAALHTSYALTTLGPGAVGQ